MKSPGFPDVYLIDQGLRRKIPNPTTMNNLFQDWSSIVETADTDTIRLSFEIDDGAVLFENDEEAKVNGFRTVYLIDRGTKRPIRSKEIFAKYNFNAKAVQTFPKLLVDSIETGDALV